MEFKKMFVVVTLAIMTTTFMGCGSEDNPPDSEQTQALSSDISSENNEDSNHSSFWSPFLGSFIGSWLGNSMSRDYYDNDRNKNTQPTTTTPANNKSTKIKDIEPPSTQKQTQSTTNDRVKGSVSPNKSITNSTGKTTGKTGIGSGGTRSSSTSKAAS